MAPPGAIDPPPVVTAITDTTTVTLPDALEAPIQSNEIGKRRRKPREGQWGIAAPSDSRDFRFLNYHGKPKAKPCGHYFSNEARLRKGNRLKGAARYLTSKPGIISLGGGLPSSEYFPFEEVSCKFPARGKFSEAETRESGVVVTAGKHDLANMKSTFDISTAFNYGQGSGAAQLLRWVTEHTELVHSPPYQDWQSTLTIGSTSGLDMTLRSMTERGDLILAEEYTFSAAVETALPLGVGMVGVPLDSDGLIPEAMDQILTNWDEKERGARKPHLLYTIPTGQNPTGATIPGPRRREIYAVCQKHDVYIIEDEPYYFLQMQPYTGANAPQVPPPSSHAEFLKSLVPSFLSMDTDGRVLRLDSFSKVICPGSRIGWITGPEQFIDCYKKYADVSTQSPSGISQLLLFKLLDDHWGHDGYLDWLIFMRMEYTKRRDVILRACEKHLPRSIISWNPPAAGMFHWMKVDFRQHPDYPHKSIEKIEEEIFLRVVDNRALVMRGSWFYASEDEEHDTLFFRATYAAAKADQIEEAVRRFGQAIREEFRLGAETDGH